MDNAREPGHVFISYVHEDADEIDRLEEVLTAAGFRIWRDVNELWGGQDWKIEIKKAITNGSFAFLACFSPKSEAKTATYQREEIILATEQMRLRSLGATWFIPIRLGDCVLPTYDLGAGRDLNSLQRVDLFGNKREQNLGRLITTVARILNRGSGKAPTPPQSPTPPAGGSPVARLKDALHVPTRQIEVSDLLTDTAADIRTALEDLAEFPNEFTQPGTELDRIRAIMTTAHKYEKTVEPLLELLATGCAWGTPQHSRLLARTIQAAGSAATKVMGGSTALLNLRRYPLTIALYAGGIGAMCQGNYESLRAITTDATQRVGNKRIATISVASPWRSFDDDTIPQLLAQEAGGTSLDDVLSQYAPAHAVVARPRCLIILQRRFDRYSRNCSLTTMSTSRHSIYWRSI